MFCTLLFRLNLIPGLLVQEGQIQAPVLGNSPSNGTQIVLNSFKISIKLRALYETGTWYPLRNHLNWKFSNCEAFFNVFLLGLIFLAQFFNVP